MTNQASAADVSTHTKAVFYLSACYLIGSVIYRALVPAHEYAMRSEQVLTMLLDAALIVGLFGMRTKFPNAQPLLWGAVACGITLFVFRITSDAAWWTGHLMYRL